MTIIMTRIFSECETGGVEEWELSNSESGHS